MDIFNGLVDNKIVKVLEIFLKNPKEVYHINKVSQESSVPLATTFRIINNLVDNEILEIQKISKFKIYRLKKNKKTKELRKLI